MSLLTRLTGRMSRADRKAWAAATTLADLGELTALWLEGRIESQPGYYGPVDTDEADAPGMTATLIGLNRAGFVTNQSQAGCISPGYDNAGWQQRASVMGLADDATLSGLRHGLRGTPIQIIVQDLQRPFRRAAPGVVVTTRAGQPYTDFGGQMGRDEFDTWYGFAVGTEAMTAVLRARQVTLVDPEWGRNDLWPAIDRVLARWNA